MIKTFFCFALLLSGSVFAATDHYILREGNHVNHLKVTKIGNDIKVTADVDYEPNAEEKGAHSCSAEITGEGKSTGENKIQLKKRSEGEASFCTLDIEFTASGAKVEQSKDCDNFVTGICHFSTNDKELVKIK